MHDPVIEAGTVLAGKYRVERVLGSGGMGVVVAAIHLELGQRVALKFLLPRAIENPEAASRFLREARAAVRIESEHVARVVDVGRLDGGAPFLVMEYLEGTDLAAYASGKRLPVEDAVDFVMQACSAMAVAHSVGVIHRDLKPANLFITTRPDGSPLIKVLDFGISKLSLMDAPAALTHTSAIMGSPLYMSPEQAQSARSVDYRTDIWSLGVILYELLTGEVPFPGDSLTEVIAALLNKSPRPMHELRPDVPLGLERAVLRALEKPLERRFANVGELSAALLEFAPARSRLLHERVSGVLMRAGISSMPPPNNSSPPLPPLRAPEGQSASPAGTDPTVSATETNWTGRERSARSRLRLPLVLGGALALTALAFALRRGNIPSASLSASTAPDAASLPALATASSPPSTTEREVAAAPPNPALDAALAPTPDAAPASSALAPKPLKTSRAPAPLAAPKLEPDAAARAAASAQPPRKKSPLSIEFK